ncbi:MAG: hypothetical protein IJH65_03780 [Methanobrevibacter sp.]|nr:hypothetical protein [Methanobrevibacter sp.]
MVFNIKDDLSKLTTIDVLYINRIFDKIIWCLSDYVEEAIDSGEDSVEVNFGFGSIIINIEEDAIKYKFKPSKTLDESIIGTVIDGKNCFTLTLEKNLVQKITNIYKDMF